MRNETARMIAVAAALVTAAGCSDDFPPANEGHRIRGTVAFEGVVPDDFEVPAVVLAAFQEFPPVNASSSVVAIESPDFAAGPVAYELRDMPAGDYYVLAQIKDLNEAAQADDPLGAYPSFCALTEEPSGPVTVTTDAPTDGVDIMVYDQAGFADPCTAAWSTLCPTEGNATLELALTSSITPADPDQMVIALFDTSPPEGFPRRFRQFTAAEVMEFPFTFLDSNIPPGTYAITLCYDVGGDDLTMGQCGDEDVSGTVDDGALVTFEAGKVVTVDWNLDDLSHPPPRTLDASELACE